MDLDESESFEILDNYTEGFRRYETDGVSVTLSFVSNSLSEMLGFQGETGKDNYDLYLSKIHPEDQLPYTEMIRNIAFSEGPLSAVYRIIRKDGTYIYVKDEMRVVHKENKSVAYATFTDITGLKDENENLRFLNDTIPCGMVKFGCEKNPKITFINTRMKDILLIPAEQESFENGEEHIYQFIPVEYRRRFRHFLNQINVNGKPMTGEITLMRSDGIRVRLFGWTTKGLNKSGEEEYQSVCMDITEMYRNQKRNEIERYVKAISDIYDDIYEYDLLHKTMRHIWAKDETFSKDQSVVWGAEEGTEELILTKIAAKNKKKVKDFFSSLLSHKILQEDPTFPEIRFEKVGAEKEGEEYSGILLKLDTNTYLLCIRKINISEISDLITENEALKNRNKNIQDFVMSYTDGMTAFEIYDNAVTPLYYSENVCRFFGYEKEEWLSLMREKTPIRKFIKNTNIDYDVFKNLLKQGEGEFLYHNVLTGDEEKIKAICSRRESGDRVPQYVLLYKMKAEKERSVSSRVFIRTFGYFDVFVDNKPIVFHNKKAKELLAILVDRKGGFITSGEAISYLWEEEDANVITLARYRKEALRLKKTLEENGVEDIIETVDGKRRIVPEKIKCDLYDYLSGKDEYRELFNGSYLSNYSWAEVTLGELTLKSGNL